MSASIKAGLNNDMHLMTDGVTRAYVDGNGKVGIGTSSPGRDLHINGTSVNSKAFTRYTHDGLASNGLDVGYSSGGYASIYNAENTAMVFSTNASERMRIDASGYVTKPNQPCAWVTGTGDYVSMNNELMRFTVINHQTGGSNYNTSSKLYTCPIAGWYECSAHALTQSTQSCEFQLKKNGTTVARRYVASDRGISTHNVVYCSANDTLGWYWASSGSVHYQGGEDAYSSGLYRLVG